MGETTLHPDGFATAVVPQAEISAATGCDNRVPHGGRPVSGRSIPSPGRVAAIEEVGGFRTPLPGMAGASGGGIGFRGGLSYRLRDSFDRTMKRSQLEAHRKTLLALRDEILREAAIPLEPARRDPTRVGADEDEQPLTEMLQVIASNRNRNRATELARIEAALRRIDENPDDFGLCQECEEEISERRLAAMPYVERCVDCQSAKDGPRGGTRRHLTDYR